MPRSHMKLMRCQGIQSYGRGTNVGNVTEHWLLSCNQAIQNQTPAGGLGKGHVNAKTQIGYEGHRQMNEFQGMFLPKNSLFV